MACADDFSPEEYLEGECISIEEPNYENDDDTKSLDDYTGNIESDSDWSPKSKTQSPRQKATPLKLFANKSVEPKSKKAPTQKPAVIIPMKRVAPAAVSGSATKRAAASPEARQAVKDVNAATPSAKNTPTIAHVKTASNSPAVIVLGSAAQRANAIKLIQALPSSSPNTIQVVTSSVKLPKQHSATKTTAAGWPTVITVSGNAQPGKGVVVASKSVVPAAMSAPDVPLVIKDIRQCMPQKTDSLPHLKMKLDYVNRMLKTQQTLIGKLRGRTQALMSNNMHLREAIDRSKKGPVTTPTTSQKVPIVAGDKPVMTFGSLGSFLGSGPIVVSVVPSPSAQQVG